MRFTGACVCAGLVLVGCGSRPIPTGPTSTIGLNTIPTFTVSGVVTAGGVPAAGVRVLVLEQPHAVSMTDARGYYSIQARTSQPWGLSPLLSASKPGYFTDLRFTDANYLPIMRDTQLDFELQPVVPISVGDVVRHRVAPAACSHWGYGTGSCQRFAVTVPSSGTLDVIVSAAVINFDVDIVRPDGTFAAYVPFPSSSPVRIKVPVDASATYEIRLIDPSSAFELTTGLH